MPAPSTRDCLHCDQLTAAIEAAHEHAVAALSGRNSGRFDAVVWLSAHLAAIDHVVTPLVDRYVPRDEATRQEEQRARRELHGVLRALEQIEAADALAPPSAAPALRAQLASLLTEHAATEHLLIEQLARALGPDAVADVAARYERAVATGPTRPHPHAPQARWLERLTFAFDRTRDRLLDVLDSRHVPIPAPRRPRPVNGRWARYLLGATGDTPDAGRG